MTAERRLLEDAYEAFNVRDIDGALVFLSLLCAVDNMLVSCN